MKTWMFESATVILILSAIAYLTGNTLINWISAFAIWCTFSHAQITDRMMEEQGALPKPSVKCYKKSLYFFIAKELGWLAFFLLQHSYPALIGVGIFLLYPVWRKYWRKIHPKQLSVAEILGATKPSENSRWH